MDLSKLPKPNFATLKPRNIDQIMENLGNAEPPPTKKGRPIPADALRLDQSTLQHRERTKARKFFDLATSRRAIEHVITLPAPEESFHCIMGGDYHGFDLVIAVQHLAAEPVDDLRVATLGFNRHNIAHLCEMLDARTVRTGAMLCSEYFASADPADFNFARAELARRGFVTKATRNHAKVLLFAIGARRFVVESSANLRSCSNLEQFTLTQSVPLYDFHRRWIDHVIAHG